MAERNILDKLRLDGKRALVTGGARGIGLSITEALVQAGAEVAIVDLDLDTAEREAQRLAEHYGSKVLAWKTDVTDEAEVDQLMDELVEEFGGLDIAFANAGICINVPALEMTLDQWQKVIDVNLTGVFLTARAAAKQMIRQGSGGSIVNTASMSGHIVNVPQPQASYNASKAGVIQLTKSLAVELVEHKIRVNSISPGYIGTDLTLESEALKPLIPIWQERTPMGRLGRPDELQAIALYLAGDASSFTTGSDFVVDGGFTSV